MDALAHAFARVLIALFFAGMAGSLIVVLLTLIRDVGGLFRERANRNG